MAYTLFDTFLAELMCTCLLLVCGNGAIADATLPGTKGHGIGHFGIALAYGFGTGLPLVMFGHVGVLMNPAITLSRAAFGEYEWHRVPVAMASQMLGAFLGSLLVWLLYFDHFQPLDFCEDSHAMEDDDSELAVQKSDRPLKVCQELAPSARRYASAGNTLSDKRTSKWRGRKTTRDADNGGHVDNRQVPGSTCNPLQYVATSIQSSSAKECGRPTVACASHLKDMKMVCENRRHSRKLLSHRILEDEHVKLGVFAIRPAKTEHYYITSLFSEMLTTALLTFGAAAIGRRKLLLEEANRALYAVLDPFMLGFWVWTLIVSVGGVSGPAMNPARDLPPRFLHWILPIPGKGSSEWWFAWVPLVGGFIGAFLGQGLDRAFRHVTAAHALSG